MTSRKIKQGSAQPVVIYDPAQKLFLEGSAIPVVLVDGNGAMIDFLTFVHRDGSLPFTGNQSMASFALTNVGELRLPFEPAVDDTASGFVITATVDTNTQGVGAALQMAADGHYDEADADSVTTAPCTALALEAGTGARRVLLHGIIRNDGWTWVTGPGELCLIYLSTTTGQLTQTPPAGSGDVVQVVGYALSDDVMYFNPQLQVIELT